MNNKKHELIQISFDDLISEIKKTDDLILQDKEIHNEIKSELPKDTNVLQHKENSLIKNNIVNKVDIEIKSNSSIGKVIIILLASILFYFLPNLIIGGDSMGVETQSLVSDLSGVVNASSYVLSICLFVFASFEIKKLINL